MKFSAKPALLALVVCGAPTALCMENTSSKATIDAGLTVLGMMLTGGIAYGVSNSALLKKGLSVVGVGPKEAATVTLTAGGFLSAASWMPALGAYGYLTLPLWATYRIATSQAFLGTLQRTPLLKDIVGDTTAVKNIAKLRSGDKLEGNTEEERADNANAGLFSAVAVTAAAWGLVKFGLERGFNYPDGILKMHLGLVDGLRARLS